MKLPIKLRWAAVAASAVVGSAAIGLGVAAAAGGPAASTGGGQSYSAVCPAADVVTPALNSNLIENPGAEDYTALTTLGEPATDLQYAPDCWVSTSPMGGQGAVLESAASSAVPGQTGSRTFYGGYDYDSPQVSIVGVTTTATQLIDVSSLGAGTRAYTLTGEIGGYTTQTDYATVTARFEDAAGAPLGSAVLGPVDPAQRTNVTSLIPQAATGTVPAGTAQILITVASTGVSAGYGIDGRADNLNLTISSGDSGQSYTVPCPASDTVTPALNSNLIENPGAEDSTAATALGAPAGDDQTVADCWTSASPLAAPDGTQESSPSTNPGVTGSRVFYGGTNPSTVAVAGVVTTGSQVIDVSSLKAAGQPFKLTGKVGGYSTQSDYAEVVATFENASGASLGTAQIGPATPADRANVSELLPDGAYGTVPDGTAKILVTIITGGVNAGANSDGTADDLNLTIGQNAVGQSYTVPCPASDTVTPALNSNLIENPSAEDSTTATALGAPLGDDQTVADCWTSASPLSPPDGTQESRTSTYPGVTGSRVFYGGTNPSTVSIPGISTTGTQSVDLSALAVGGQPFKLSADLGGYSTQGDYATVTAAFQDTKGATLSTAKIGPVTAAQRGNASSLIPQAWYGDVPAGTQKVVVTIATVGVSSGANSDGTADNLNLTIGQSAVPSGPVLQTMPYASVGDDTGTHVDPGSGAVVPNVVPGALDRPAGVSAFKGTVDVSNTGDNVVSALQNGSTSVIAGSLEAYGEHGDGGKATSASLYQPSGSATDAAGDLFVADAGDNVVREIAANGTISRFAGTVPGGSWSGAGLGGLVPLDHPEAVAVNAAGDVFIADTYADRVVELTPRGLLLRLIGTGRAGYSGDGRPSPLAQLNQPIGLALDAQGDLYIADSANNVIRRVDARTGIITTVAGDHAAGKAAGGLGGFSGDGGPATSAQLNDPQGVAVDGAGDLFVADTFDNAIREVTPDGTISTVVNSSAAPGGESSGAAPTASHLNTPYAVTVDPSTDLLYIADTRNSVIAQVIGLARAGHAPGPVAPPAS
ncbi:NHL repeat containing protein [Catenulispora acidiphila DSM 44928]|uniref:NHL repeat containing protein n=1 Tax=Catenulispora acidiphila (strain DSM 44928 / JCM 14897 / NBRC 102108 / NRRL B-24433 / ID139908) TaxID=479433 RepID=C7QDE8_CATAD|nr:NHL repeat containing protein [Catenulispora acidiphila]ACU72741.1 NHL repeat containing protein [Catenulispora acidiphila DSM 44928]